MRVQNEKLAEMIDAIHKAIAAAETYAAENDLTFYLDGLGRFCKAESIDEADMMGVEKGEYGWYTSTMSCS